MADNYQDVTWTAVDGAPDGVLPKCVPCGFKRETYPATGTVTHYRFIPACIHEWPRLPDTEDFP